MKKLFLTTFFSLAISFVFGQKVYFLYLQTEQNQPFFVRMNDKTYSSTASGYLILSKLHDSTYDFSVGFPQSKSSEQKFSVVLNGKDHGYLIKDFGDKGLGLFDLQTMAVINQLTVSNKNNTNTTNTNVSSFTEMLAKATDDSTLKQKTVEPNKPDEKKTQETIQPVTEKKEVVTTSQAKEIKTDPDNKKDDISPKQEQKEESNVSLPYKKSIVTRKSESSTTKGLGIVYIDDHGNGIKDTIRILIADVKPVSNETKEESKQDKKFLDIIEDSSKVKTTSVPSETMTKSITLVDKNSCTAIADENDFYLLRKNMAAETNDDDMVDAAKKYFKTKCFSVSQLKNLGTLFLNDAGKYKFFDAAYNHVTDPDNFATLQSELKDDYYINRFKAMLQ